MDDRRSARTITLDPVLLYRDGARRTSTGALPPETVAPEEDARSRVVELPHASTDVLFRLGAYDVVREIGRGGMGTVYEAWSVKLARNVAIKVFEPRRRASEIDLARFQNEVMLAARLKHPNIVAVFDAGDDDGRPYFVMELVEGGSLASLVRPSKDVPRALVEAVRKTALALHVAHEKGIVHRDVKPDNVLLHRTGARDDQSLEPCVTDFGIAKSLLDAPGLTREGRALGTPFYMPPEQANGEHHLVGPRSDVYALGATLYHLLAGRPPFTGDDEFVVLAKILNEDPEPPGRVAARWCGRAVPPDLETICLRAMEKEAARRYATAKDLADDLGRFLDGDVIRARPSSLTERVTKKLRRHRGAWLAALAVVAVLATLVLAFGALAVDSVARTDASLVEKSRSEALHRAATLERAIRLNMLQGRADQARALMQMLNATPEAGEIRVVRTDRKLAYTDPATREKVQRYLATPGVLERIKAESPDMLPAIDVLQRVAFPKIDGATTPATTVHVEKEAWNRALLTAKPQHYSEDVGGTPWLVVLWPIENARECRVCHSDPSPDGYAHEPVRAVLVVRSSQADVMETVRANRTATIRVGVATAAAFLVLLAVFSRVLGARTSSFGVVRAPATGRSEDT